MSNGTGKEPVRPPSLEPRPSVALTHVSPRRPRPSVANPSHSANADRPTWMHRRAQDPEEEEEDKGGALGGLGGHADKLHKGEQQHHNPISVLGENLGVTTAFEKGGKQVKKVGDFAAKQADKAMVSNVKVVLKMIGAKMNAQLHDDAMPIKLHNGINILFKTMWPEISKGDASHGPPRGPPRD